MSTSRLVIIDDGFQLRAVTVGVAGLAGPTYTATAIDFAAALSEIKQQFPDSQRAILVSQQVHAGSVNLPPGAEIRLGFQELNQAIYFELISRLSKPELLLGEILLHRNIITHSQLTHLLQSQKDLRKKQQNGGHRSLGILAVKAEYATQAEIDQCLDIQEQLSLQNHTFDNPVAGISPAKPTYGSQSGQSVAITSDTNRNTWMKAFKKIGFKLEAIAPLAGATTTAMLQQYESGTVIELHATYLNIAPLGEPSASVETISFGGKPLDSTHISNLIRRINSSLQIICTTSEEIYEAVIATGEQTTSGVELVPLSPDYWQWVAQSINADWITNNLTVIPLKNPPVPIREQTWFRWAVASCIFLAAILLGELIIEQQLQPLHESLNSNQNTHIKLDEKLEKLYEWEFGISQQQLSQVSLEQQIVPLRGIHSVLKETLANRNRFHLELLKTLINIDTKGVMIELFRSRSGDSFELSAWSLTPQQGNVFVEQLTTQLNLSQLSVEVLATRTATGTANVPGTELLIKISPLLEDATISSEETNNVKE
jgi:hypothetical protein